MGDMINEVTGISGYLESGSWKYLIMVAAALVLIYLATVKKYEPLLLFPIAMGILLANLPGTGIADYPTELMDGGLIYYLKQGMAVIPPLIFVGVGAITDFSPVIANPKLLLFGGAAQVGILTAFAGATALGFTPMESAAIGIIGSADGPTTIYTASTLAPDILGVIAIAAYSYMALVPIIQPPIMRALTTRKERAIKMEYLREVSRKERIIFPIATILVTAVLVPKATTLVGMLMLGNLLREVGVVDRLAKAASEYLMYICILLLGLCVGASTKADVFLTSETLIILFLGLFAFAVSTAAGVLFGKL
ncbi:MAG: sodium ion-translocating decarboxylase subunit beta, partial [Oscillospiraceae bacterium]|nr:sodium ion-translocating decarboxylase subunit beta [Oscillospiraceae bacterium]